MTVLVEREDLKNKECSIGNRLSLKIMIFTILTKIHKSF